MDKCDPTSGSQPLEVMATEETAIENDVEVKPKPPNLLNENLLNHEVLPLGSSKMPKHF